MLRIFPYLQLIVQTKKHNITQEDPNKKIDISEEKDAITWHEIKLNNITFSLPSNIQNNENLTNNQRKVYISNDETIGITIDFAPLPPDQSANEISKIISDISSFGQSINEDNRRIIDDFRLVNTYYSKLGFKESIEVHQVSKKISGKDIEMNVKANFIISIPNYYSITFSYPRSSISDEKTVEQIKKIIMGILFFIKLKCRIKEGTRKTSRT